MIRSLLLGVLFAFVVSPVYAQQGPPFRGGGPRDRSMWFDRMLNRMADELELDESQRVQFDEITASHRQRMQEVGQRWRELRQATRDGDEQRAAELRAELESARPPGDGFSSLLDEVRPLLRDDQLERLQTMQDRMQERRRQGEMYRRIMTELPEELGLDDAQREQWDEILASRREQRRQRWEEMRPVWEEMRTAEEAGDEQRLAELRQQLEGARPDPQEMFATFFEQLEGMLRDDQKEILDAYRTEFGIGAAAESGEPGDLRNILRAVKRVRLNNEQREAVRDIERDAGRARREIDRRDAEAHKQLAKSVKQQLTKILDAEQTREFEENLARLDRDVRRSQERRPARTP